MSEGFRATPPEQQWSSGSGYDGDARDGEVGKALLVGLLGGLVSAAGYMIYRRLPDEQKERLHAQVRTQIQQKISEIRDNFNL